MLELRRLLPDAQYLYTHFSPSAESLARRLPADAADYLPYDLPGSSERLLDALRPSLLVFAKLDLWPELATRAANRGVPVAMVAATVSPGSGRLTLAGEDRPPRGLPGGGPRRGRLRRGCRTAGPARRRLPTGSRCWATRARTACCAGSGRWTRGTRCFDSETAGRPWWQAPPGRPTRTCCSTRSPGCAPGTPVPASSWFPTSPRPLTSRRWKTGRAGRGSRLRCA